MSTYQCKCGGLLQPRESVRSGLGLRLEWGECKACGRCDFWKLYARGELAYHGREARDWYAALTDPEQASHMREIAG